MVVKNSIKIVRNFSAFVKYQRKKNALSLDQLAKKAGVSKSTVTDVENNRTTPTIATCKKIADAFDMNLYNIIKDIESGNFEPKEGPITNCYLDVIEVSRFLLTLFTHLAGENGSAASVHKKVGKILAALTPDRENSEVKFKLDGRKVKLVIDNRTGLIQAFDVKTGKQIVLQFDQI